MHVGLNLIFLVPGETGGTETYARELIRALQQEAPELALTAFINRESAADSGFLPSGVQTVTIPVEARNRLDWVRGEQLLLPRAAANAGVDLLHSLGNTAPARGKFRRVVTIHDLHYLVAPDAHFGIRGYGMRLLVPLAARSSHRVITISQTSAHDISKHLRVPKDRLDVIPSGLGQPLTQRASDTAEIGSRYGIGERQVVLTLSAKRPHKNLMRLLQALALLPSARRPLLFLPGYPTPHEEELRREAARLSIDDDVRFLGWLAPHEMEALFATAHLFVFPSLYEGFALPILEAMARGVPVCCSNRGAMMEVAADAAVLFDPESPQAIAAAIDNSLASPSLLARLRDAGPRRAEAFSWERAARATRDTYVAAMRTG